MAKIYHYAHYASKGRNIAPCNIFNKNFYVKPLSRSIFIEEIDAITESGWKNRYSNQIKFTKKFSSGSFVINYYIEYLFRVVNATR